MNLQQHNLFIIDNNATNSLPLKKFLNNKFGTSLQITSYQSAEFALSKINKETHIVIMDSNLEGTTGNILLQSIKKINPKTEVIVLTSNEDIAIAIQSFRKGATDYVITGDNAFKKIANIIYDILLYPVRLLLKEFQVRKYLFIFLLTFITVGLIVYFTLEIDK